VEEAQGEFRGLLLAKVVDSEGVVSRRLLTFIFCSFGVDSRRQEK
jgi:hypothetical protein